MRQAFKINVPNIINDLKLTSNQTEFVLKSYKNVYRNNFNAVSMDVQMQTMCANYLERFNSKLMSVNLSDLAIYQYLSKNLFFIN
jgi:hypothetical protein